jgi:NAD(P)-dependent dehydrogenase (short-subunit alcohol dehydrogenase family)
MTPSGLDELAAQARRDFARLNFPAANWVPPALGPDGKPMLDVLVIGAGANGDAALAEAPDRARSRISGTDFSRLV